MPFYASAIGPQSARKAGKAGYHLIAAAQPAWTSALEEGGYDPGAFKAQTLLPVVVADTADEAWEVGGEGLLYHANFYQLRYRLDGTLPDPRTALTKVDLIRDKEVAVGSPEEVIEQITEIYKSYPEGTTGLAFQLRSPGATNAAVEKSMGLFAKHVMPIIREL